MLALFIGLAVNALLARLLTPQDLGAYFLAYSVVLVGALLGALGLGQAVVKLVAESVGLNLPGRVRSVIRITLGAGTLGSIGIGFIYLLYGDSLAEHVFDAPALAAVTGLVAGWIVVTTIQGLLAEIFRGFHDIRLATILGSQMLGGATGLTTVGMLSASLFLLWLTRGQTTLGTVLLISMCSGADFQHPACRFCAC